MGQQQLLLLVLATVIVGLATVAGIQAFDENQSQAAQDALTQRGYNAASDLKGLARKPQEQGGIDLDSKSSNTSHTPKGVRKRLGYEKGSNGARFPVAGAPGNNPECSFGFSNNGNGGQHADIKCKSSEAPQDVRVRLNASGDYDVSTSYADSYTLNSP